MSALIRIALLPVWLVVLTIYEAHMMFSSRKLGVSATALSPMSMRWMQHQLRLRRDDACATPQPGEFPENNVVHGRLYRCGERWQERRVIILLPGYNDSASYNLRFPLLASRCNRAGLRPPARLRDSAHFSVTAPLAPNDSLQPDN